MEIQVKKQTNVIVSMTEDEAIHLRDLLTYTVDLDMDAFAEELRRSLNGTLDCPDCRYSFTYNEDSDLFELDTE